MDNNNWRPTPPGGEPNMETPDWRTQLQPDSRQRIVNKIMDTLKRHLPFSGPEGLNELKKIAGRFEEKIYTAATNQSDYLRRISLKMLSMESKSQTAMSNSLQPNSGGTSNKPPDPGSVMQIQVHNQGQSLPIPLSANQPQPRQQLLSQNIQNNMATGGVQSSAGLPSVLPPASGLNQTPISTVVGQNSNMQNIYSVSQNVVGSSMGQGAPSNLYANSQRQMQGRQQVLSQQQQQQSQNSQQFLYQQQIQQQLMKQKLHQGNLSHPLMMQQQQQQNLVQPNQLQSSQQSGMQSSSVMQPSVMQSASHSSIQQNQQSSVQQSTQPMIQQHPQSVLRPQQQQQSVGVHQQQTPITQQTMMAPQQPQQQQQLMGQSNAANMQQNQLTGQQNSVGDMQQQQQQKLLGQHSNLPNLQQQQQQQQLMGQQSLSSLHHQQLGSQSNVTGLQQQQQQQQLLGTQSGNPNMPTNQHSVHILQQPKVPMQQQPQQSAPNLLSSQGQQSQPQPGQQQLMSQIQSQPAQLQQQMGLQQQPNALQRDMQQRLQASSQASGSLLQPQNVVDQQKQLYQPQRALPETSSTGQSNGGDWQEEVYQKIKVMKDMYFPEINEMYQKIASKLQQHDSLPQQPKLDQLEKLKIFRSMLERIIGFLQVSKINVQPGYKEKLGSYEKQIVNFINSNRPRKPSMQQGQLPPPHMHSMQQPSQVQLGLQRDMQQRLQASTSLDSTAGQSNGGDWQEEVYQKIKVMKEMYFPELNEMYRKIATKLQQHDSLPQQPKSEQLEKLKIFKNMLERILGFLQVSKINVQPSYKEKLGSYEKQILNFINTNRPRKPSMQQGQLPPPHMHSMQQPSQVQSHDNQMNPQMQSMDLQGSVATMQQNNMTSLQHNAISSISGVSTAQHNMLNSLQSGSNLYSGQGNT